MPRKIAVIIDDEARVYHAARALHALHDEGRISARSGPVLAKDRSALCIALVSE